MSEIVVYSGIPMNFTQLLAAVGACTGIASLSWNIYLKLSAGPKLRVQAWAGMVKRPAPAGDPQFLKVSIRNIGTAQTTLTNYALYQYSSNRRGKNPEFAAVLNIYEGATAPYKLGIGEEAMILMEQDLAFDRMLKKSTIYFVVWHAFANKPIQVPIFVPSEK